MSPHRKSAFRPGTESSAPLFAALGDPTRLRLLDRLCEGTPQSIAQLTVGTQVSRQAITKHLRVMQRAGLMRCIHNGREAMWSVDRRRLDDARRYLNSVSEQWDRALVRLRKMVEE